ncbi:MAG TPA: SIR2 family protein [Noviherbaspirillum sp.]
MSKPAGQPSVSQEGKDPTAIVQIASDATLLPPVRLEELFPEYTAENYRQRATEARNQLIAELRKSHLSEGVVLYIGAGVSMSIGLPSWNELIQSLTVAMMSRRVNSAANALSSLTDDEKAAALKALLDEVKRQKASQKPILMMARAIKDEFGSDLPHQVAAHLYGRLRLGSGVWKRLFGFFSGKAKPVRAGSEELELPTSPLVDAVVALVRPQRGVVGVQAIVNYNYDDIVEERLRQESIPCLTVLSGKLRLNRGKLPSYHVHGVLPVRDYLGKSLRPKQVDIGNFVFSEDEYHTEYADPYRWSNLTQISLLGRHKGLFIGLSMQDPNLRRLIDVTHKQYPEIWNYAVLPRSSAAPNEDEKTAILRNLAEDVETKSFQKIGVKVLWVDDIQKDIAPLLTEISQLPDD